MGLIRSAKPGFAETLYCERVIVANTIQMHTLNQECSAARTLELVGERWSLLVLRYAASHRTLHHFCLLVAKRRHHPDLAIVASDADAATWLGQRSV